MDTEDIYNEDRNDLFAESQRQKKYILELKARIAELESQVEEQQKDLHAARNNYASALRTAKVRKDQRKEARAERDALRQQVETVTASRDGKNIRLGALDGHYQSLRTESEGLREQVEGLRADGERLDRLTAQHRRDIELRRAVDRFLMRRTASSPELKALERAYEDLHTEEDPT